MSRYIKVSDLQRKMCELSADIRRCKNRSLKRRLEEEHTAYAITLRNIPQYDLPRQTITIKK